MQPQVRANRVIGKLEACGIAYLGIAAVTNALGQSESLASSPVI